MGFYIEAQWNDCAESACGAFLNVMRDFDLCCGTSNLELGISQFNVSSNKKNVGFSNSIGKWDAVLLNGYYRYNNAYSVLSNSNS